MKRLYFLLIGLLLLNFSANAFVGTVNATGAIGSYKTGYTQAATGRTDGNMVIDAVGTIKRGYAVFNLASILPPGAVVSAVSIRFNYLTSGPGTTVTCGIYGYAGDLSTVTTTATLFADCATGTAFNTTNWGASTTGSQDVLPFNATGVSFIQSNTASTVSIGFATSAGANVYTITGEGGTTATQPQLQITYTCTAPPINGASSVICTGTPVTLSDATTGGTWSSSSTTTTITSAGVVNGSTPGTATITYTTALGCTNTAVVTVNQTPAPIGGATSVCVGRTAVVTDASGPGTWSSSNTLQASVNPGGVVYGISGGVPTITYTVAGCSATIGFAVNVAPMPIAGTASACPGTTTTLSDPAGTGTWTSGNTGIAIVGSSNGVVTGIAAGTVPITYANGCGAPVSTTVIINSLPSGVHGQGAICSGSTTTLTDSSALGTWSATPSSVATVGSASGTVTAVSVGTATVSYTLPTGCYSTLVVTVNTPPAPIAGASSVCTGHTTVLTESSIGGTWSSSDNSLATVNSGIVGGVSFGNVTITYTSGPSCFLVHQMTVNPEAAVLGLDSVCLGLSTYLTNIVGGGIWTSSNIGVATVVPDSGRVTGVTTGTTTISYILPTGCRTSATFSVIAFPDNITGVAKACPGTTTNLSDATTGGIWSSANTGIATIAQNGIVSGIVADTVSVSYTIRPGCKVSALVTINPLPAPIFGATPVCPQTADSLSDASPGGTWTTSTPAIATIVDTSGVLNTLVQGAAIIKYTLPTGCYRTRTISINPLPAPTVIFDNTTTSLVTPDVYIAYQWYDSVGIITGATSPTVAALYNTFYYVIVTDSFGCKGMSALYPFDQSQVSGVSAIANNNDIKLFPNPASGILFIESSIKLRAVVNSVDGKKQLEQINAKQIDISKLASGMYFITFYNNSNQLVGKQKFIKE